MKLSVVIPVYNVKPWLRECLDSVRAQTLRDWECICVDDGSTDGSPGILKEFASSDPRFRILTHPHSNAGAARNAGLDNANGEYLLFLDSDDVFSPWMFETLLKEAEQEMADVVSCGNTQFADGPPPPVFSKPSDIEWTNRTPDPDWSRCPLASGTMPWNKIIRKQLFHDFSIRFQEQASTNDMACMALVLASSGKTMATEEPLVGYRQRKSSIQYSKDPECFLSAFKLVYSILRATDKWSGLSCIGQAQFFLFFVQSAIWELRSQTSFRRHRTMCNGIRELNSFFGGITAETLVQHSSVSSNQALSINRYLSIIRNGRKERLHAWLEGFLSPLLGHRTRFSGWKGSLANRLHRILVSVFESPKWPWNISFVKIETT